MGGSSSSNQSAQSTNQTDSRRVYGQGAWSAENSTVNIQTLDASTVNRALDTVDLTVGNALSTVYADNSMAFAFGSKALDYSTQAQAQANASLNNEAGMLATAYADAKTQSGTTNKIMIGALVMAGLVAITALKKG
jgi:hypothetical protein